ncbi:MAG TPA: GlsB/YeaQ/YmgE family stress response membrane protein [Pseudolabrys sp.]|jgi:uncharacterized membrane protein YeaQ/YmgE (transglycosylase-associated protein family)|nr:GlsB/YeaQ/YmgE family stress response membrane protein [Pseudolabrys sp.]
MYAGPLATFLLILVIGIAAAILFDRVGGRRGWFGRQISGRRHLVTSSLVGIAGSFIGYYVFVLLGIIIAGSLGFFIGAALGAAVVLWLWRDVL